MPEEYAPKYYLLEMPPDNESEVRALLGSYATTHGAKISISPLPDEQLPYPHPETQKPQFQENMVSYIPQEEGQAVPVITREKLRDYAKVHYGSPSRGEHLFNVLRPSQVSSKNDHLRPYLVFTHEGAFLGINPQRAYELLELIVGESPKLLQVSTATKQCLRDYCADLFVVQA